MLPVVHIPLLLSPLHDRAKVKASIMTIEAQISIMHILTVRQFFMSLSEVAISDTSESLYSDIQEFRALSLVTRGSWLHDK